MIESSEIKVRYQNPPRKRSGYSVEMPVELIHALMFGAISQEDFVGMTLERVKAFRATKLK